MALDKHASQSSSPSSSSMVLGKHISQSTSSLLLISKFDAAGGGGVGRSNGGGRSLSKNMMPLDNGYSDGSLWLTSPEKYGFGIGSSRRSESTRTTGVSFWAPSVVPPEKYVGKNGRGSKSSKLSAVDWAMWLPPSRFSSAAFTVLTYQRTPAKPKRKITLPIRFSSAATDVNPCQKAPAKPEKAERKIEGKRRTVEEPFEDDELDHLQERYGSICKHFTFQELSDSTSNFASENLIGKGGSGRVFKGTLPGDNNPSSAIKIFSKSRKAAKEFLLELEMLTKLRHKNIISLSGFSTNDRNNLILAYNLLSKGSLADNLHGARRVQNKTSTNTIIPWKDRYKVAVGVAKALAYLHAFSGTPDRVIVHRDVKSSNILLSGDSEPQLSDFGIALSAPSASSSSHAICTNIEGTIGYLAPEYFTLGKVDEKIDVYAYGVVLLELLSGRKAVETQPPNAHRSLVVWAKPILQSGNLQRLLDKDLGFEYDDEQVERMVVCASLCIAKAGFRPKMDTVLKLLQGGGDIEIILKWAKSPVKKASEEEALKTSSPTDFQSHLKLALLDVDTDTDVDLQHN